jgi:hypothetical protein
MDLSVIFQGRSLPNGTFTILESIKQEQDNLKEHYLLPMKAVMYHT